MSCITYECVKCGNIETQANECSVCGCTHLVLFDWDHRDGGEEQYEEDYTDTDDEEVD